MKYIKKFEALNKNPYAVTQEEREAHQADMDERFNRGNEYIQSIIQNRGYQDTLEYIGEYSDIKDFIYERKDQIIDQIESDLSENNLDYIMEYVNLDHEWLPDVVWDKHNNQLLRIGDYLYKVVDKTHESPSEILEELKYEDDDREVLNMYRTETH